jgi:hypothetical protein
MQYQWTVAGSNFNRFMDLSLMCNSSSVGLSIRHCDVKFVYIVVSMRIGILIKSVKLTTR